MRFTRAALLLNLLLVVQPVAGQQGNQLSFDNVTASPGEERIILLNGSFGDDISGLVVSILYDPSVIEILDVTNGALVQDFSLQSSTSAGRITVAMAGADAISAQFIGPVLELTIRVIGAPGSITSLTIASAVLDEGDHTAIRAHGSVTVNGSTILGSVLYYSDLRPVPEVVLTATGAEGGVEDSTDSEGN